MSKFTGYEPIKQGPVTRLATGCRYFDDKLCRWVNVVYEEGPRNFYEIDDEKRLTSASTEKQCHQHGKPLVFCLECLNEARQTKTNKKGRKP